MIAEHFGLAGRSMSHVKRTDDIGGRCVLFADEVTGEFTII